MENTNEDAQSLTEDLINHNFAFSEGLKLNEDDEEMYVNLYAENEKVLSDLQEIEEMNDLHRIKIAEGLRLKVKLMDERQDDLRTQLDNIVKKIDENNAEMNKDSDEFLLKVEEWTDKIRNLSSKYDNDNIRKECVRCETNNQELQAMIEVLKVEYAKKKDMANFQHVEDEDIKNLVGIVRDIGDTEKLKSQITKVRNEIDFIVKHNEELKHKLN